MNLYIASDHTGLELKSLLVQELTAVGHSVHDLGANSYDANDDYPDYVTPCAERVAAEPDALGIIIGGSGHGEAMAANRVKGARAVSFYGPRQTLDALESEGTTGTDGYDIVRIARMHNDANILSLGARFVRIEEAVLAVRAFVETPFSGEGRHIRRIGKF
ncbi:MAG TPA: RpiB/LacA/LacB family sugar-phosphate isomerase [Candidatus Paceibacterota bacterium]|nr:RpiB/LacA/LacB family sugar-phosphate isomerase [Candidatus Paceibacterota bacterium]